MSSAFTSSSWFSDYDTLSKSTKVGIKAGATPGIHTITAGNFDGKYVINLQLIAFEKHGINCSSIGTVTANCNVTLVRKDEEALLWDFDKKPFTGFSSSLEDVHTHGFHEELLN